jgi:hypothetical protein
MYSPRETQQESEFLWTKTIIWIGVLGLLVGAPVSVHAQGDCSDPDNRTLNCEFATDISGWVPEFGSGFSHSFDGDVGPGSVEVDSQLVSDHTAKINQCVGGLAGLSSVDVGASFRMVAGSIYGCGVEATKYGDDNCTTYMGLSGYYDDVSASVWSWIGGTLALDPSIRGIRISAICYSLVGAFTVRIDDVYLGEGVGPIIFMDGFEIGSTSMWSAAVP